MKLPKTIVGKNDTPTPIFSDRLEVIETNPHWNVPTSIFAKEILPKMKEDPTYLASKNMDLLKWSDADEKWEVIPTSDLNWKETFDEDLKKYRVRQSPGDDNALGSVKFLFPNQFAVYLHDTPLINGFKYPVRAFSHGCVRVEKAEPLAVMLGQNFADETRDALVASLKDEEKSHSFALKKPIPVYITYLTVEVKDGAIHWYQDIYGHDKPMMLKGF